MIKSKANQQQEKSSSFILYERPLQDQNPPETSVKLLKLPVNCETPPVKKNHHLIIGLPTELIDVFKKKYLNHTKIYLLNRKLLCYKPDKYYRK